MLILCYLSRFSNSKVNPIWLLSSVSRKSIFSYPEIAIRELVANMLIHQDFEQHGTNPMVEVFSDRIEFSNPGAPLINIERIIDTVPVSRNENIAGFMHKCGICEERGSGYDKIVLATGENSMLSPRLENQSNQFTKVIFKFYSFYYAKDCMFQRILLKTFFVCAYNF